MILMDKYLRDQGVLSAFTVGDEDPKESRTPAEVEDGHLANALYYALRIRDKVRDRATTTRDKLDWVEE
jgi:hypothetical protein